MAAVVTAEQDLSSLVLKLDICCTFYWLLISCGNARETEYTIIELAFGLLNRASTANSIFLPHLLGLHTRFLFPPQACRASRNAPSYSSVAKNGP